jgi:hypothetical protein
VSDPDVAALVAKARADAGNQHDCATRGEDDEGIAQVGLLKHECGRN